MGIGRQPAALIPAGNRKISARLRTCNWILRRTGHCARAEYRPCSLPVYLGKRHRYRCRRAEAEAALGTLKSAELPSDPVYASKVMKRCGGLKAEREKVYDVVLDLVCGPAHAKCIEGSTRWGSTHRDRSCINRCGGRQLIWISPISCSGRFHASGTRTNVPSQQTRRKIWERLLEYFLQQKNITVDYANRLPQIQPRPLGVHRLNGPHAKDLCEDQLISQIKIDALL